MGFAHPVTIDNSLVRRCQSGDKAAFEELLNQHYDTVYRFAYRWCGDQHNAQDITQQACIKLARSITQFRFDSSFTSWLYRLVINCAKDFYKSPNQVERATVDDSEKNIGGAIDHSISHERQLYARQVLEHINHLEDDLRDTLILVFGTGLSHRQAAESLKIQESTVSWRVHEARKRLKQTFSTSNLHNDAVDVVRGSV